MDNLNALPPILSRAFMKIENMLERQAQALERQADIAFVQLTSDQQVLVEALDQRRHERAMRERGIRPTTPK